MVLIKNIPLIKMLFFNRNMCFFNKIFHLFVVITIIEKSSNKIYISMNILYQLSLYLYFINNEQ
jgi:hypothetical protein